MPALMQPQFLISHQWRQTLTAAGLDSFAEVMNTKLGEVVRAVPGRSTVRIVLPNQSAIYLKRYTPGYLSPAKILKRFLRWPGSDDEAWHEWQMIHRLQAAGFDVPQPIATGSRRTAGVIVESFLITAEVPSAMPADDYLLELRAPDVRDFILNLADLTRRFHQAGFIHKDYYLAHILVAHRDNRLRLYLIDLQRAKGPAQHRPRWITKDLAAFTYSAIQIGVSRANLMRFFKAYNQHASLNDADRDHILQILSRTGRIIAHRPKYGTIWDQPGVRPARY